LLIWLNRAAMWSRAHPGPRFGSSHDASVSRVPHCTNSAISVRMPFSSTDTRAIFPVGRANNRAGGVPVSGSAGSFGALVCADAPAAMAAVMQSNGAKTHFDHFTLLPTANPLKYCFIACVPLSQTVAFPAPILPRLASLCELVTASSGLFRSILQCLMANANLQKGN
jgi:hypothetical protein